MEKQRFFFDAPQTDGIAVTETDEGFAFSGLWNQSSEQLTSAGDLHDLSDLMAARSFTSDLGDETFYCLENDDMQVVFSSRGGAIAEINLNLRSKTDLSSPVLPVAIDRKMQAESPQNNRYPLHKSSGIDSGGHSVIIESKEGGYTPLLRRDIIGKDGETLFKVPSSNYAMAFKGNKHLRVSNFQVTKFTKDSISFKGQVNGKDVTRSYCFVKDAPYVLDIKNSVNGYVESLAIGSGIPEFEIDSGSAPPSLLYYSFNGKKMKLSSFKMPKDRTTKDNITPDWTANANGYFALIFNPRGENAKGITTVKIEGADCPSRATLVVGNKGRNEANDFPGYEILTPYKDTMLPTSYYFYTGPIDQNVLAKVDEVLTNEITGSNPKFSAANTVRGWLTFVVDPFSKFMNAILEFFHMMTGSWGISNHLVNNYAEIALIPIQC